jgi:hypothetical protein
VLYLRKIYECQWAQKKKFPQLKKQKCKTELAFLVDTEHLNKSYNSSVEITALKKAVRSGKK